MKKISIFLISIILVFSTVYAIETISPETVKKMAEENRKTIELQRQEAEKLRVAAVELQRQEAEKIRLEVEARSKAAEEIRLEVEARSKAAEEIRLEAEARIKAAETKITEAQKESIKTTMSVNSGETTRLKVEEIQKRAEAIRLEIEEKRKNLEEKRLEFKTKKEEYIAYKETLNKIREELKANKELNIKLIETNREIRKNIKTEIERIKANNLTANGEALASVNAKIKEVKAIIAGLANTNGKITSLLNQNKAAIESKDYVKMDLLFAEMKQIQESRNNDLTSANTILNEILSSLKAVV